MSEANTLYDATLNEVNVDDVAPLHELTPGRVEALARIYRSEIPAILVGENAPGATHRYSVLDGHHRLALARTRGLTVIAAWVLSDDDFRALLTAKFDGEIPTALCRLRRFIHCGDKNANQIEGGEQCREDNAPDEWDELGPPPIPRSPQDDSATHS